MEAQLFSTILWAFGGALAGSIIFFFVGMIAGTSETATIAPSTLLVVLLGFPPEACFTFCIAAVIAKHIIHAVPTALLGIPGDTMAVPLLEPCGILRRLGAPHIALQKMISAGVLASFLAIPIAVGFGATLAPFAGVVKNWAGAIFTVVALLMAYTSKGRWASILSLVPFACIIHGLNKVAISVNGKGVVICFFMAFALGPMLVDLLTALSPGSRKTLERKGLNEVWLAPALKTWKGFIPNPIKMLTRKQKLYTAYAAVISAFTFTFSPVGMTVMIGEVVRNRVKGLYARSTTMAAVMNGTTESTYLAEIIIPLVAFGLPLSPIAMGVAFPLFNAPPVFTTEPLHNLHTLMTPLEFLGYGMLAACVAAFLCYPLAMNYARSASLWVSRHISQEAVLSMFASLIIVLAFFEAGWVGVAIAITVGFLGGIFNKFFGVNIGVQFMAFYATPFIMKTLFNA